MINLYQHLQCNPVGYECIFDIYTPSHKLIGQYKESELTPKLLRQKVKRFTATGRGVGGIIRVAEVILKEWDE